MKTLIALVTLAALAVFVLLALVGCSKYEFNDPTGASAKIVYDHTGTAATVAQQQQQQQQQQRAAQASAAKN
jgi:nitrogen fixation-related uncharacterized protein